MLKFWRQVVAHVEDLILKGVSIINRELSVTLDVLYCIEAHPMALRRRERFRGRLLPDFGT
jgi:hypothetical protein